MLQQNSKIKHTSNIHNAKVKNFGIPSNMKDLIKLYSIVICRTIVFKLQLFIRFCLNGKCYPTKQQRENGNFKDYWIGWIAYKYFSKFTVLNNWLVIDFVLPTNDFIFVTTANGDKMTMKFEEILKIIKK